nr:response regulator [Desulfonema magnum]
MLEGRDSDLVLMDVQMPEIDGVEATKMIRDPVSEVRNRNIPIIAITAHAMNDDRQGCLDAGMNAYISKPIQPEELYRVISYELSLASDQLPVNNEQVIADSSSPTTMTSDNCTDKRIFCREELLARVGDNESFCQNILKQLPKHLQDEIEKLKADMNENDAKRIRMNAHTIKGTASNVAAHRLSDVAYEIEIAAKKGELDKARLLMDKLEQEYDIFLSVLADIGLTEQISICS